MRETRVKAYRRGLFARLSCFASRATAHLHRGKRRIQEDAAAKQRRRIIRAAQYWLAGHPDYAGHDIAFDVVLAAPWAWPRYIENAFSVA